MKGVKIINTNNLIKEYIFNELKKGNLKVGDKIPSENQLMHILNVSYRGKIRSDLQSLKNIGIIESIQGSGNYINDNLNLNEFKEITQLMIELKIIDIKHIYNFRQILEQSIFEDNTKINNDILLKVIPNLELNLQKMELYIFNDDNNSFIENLVEQDFKFHCNLLKLLDNPLIDNIMDILSSILRKSIENFWKTSTFKEKENLMDIHKDILKYVIKNNKDSNIWKEMINNHYEKALS